MTTNTINLFVTNLGMYNEGISNGEWFDLQQTSYDEIMSTIGVQDNSQYEEYAIHDYEAPFSINEYSSITNLIEIANKMNELSTDEIQAITELLENNIVSSFDEGINQLENVIFYNECSNMSDVAYQWYEESGQLSELEKHINVNYIDFDAIGRDMEIEGTFFQLDSNTYIEYIG